MGSTQIDKIVKVYKLIVQNPSLNGAKILKATGHHIRLQSEWSQRNLERKTTQKFLQEHNLANNFEVISQSFPIDSTNEYVDADTLMSATTDNLEQRAVLRQVTIENSTKQFIEIWNKQRLIKNYDLSALDVHGDVYTDSDFGSFEWSPDKTKLLYIAEKKLPKSEPFYKQKSLDKKENEKEKKDEDVQIGKEYDYKQDWGEQLVGRHRPVVVVLDTATDNITVESNIPDDLSPGQVIWTKDGKSIIGVAWKHEPRRLGLVVCTNRLSWIFSLKNGEFRKISCDGNAVRCPRISLDGKYLIWLERKAGGGHHDAHKLVGCNLETEDKKIDTLIDIIRTNISINNGRLFYGIYGRLPSNCWSTDSRYIFFSTPQQNNICSYVFDRVDKDITEIENNNTLLILDVKDNVIAFLKTSLLEPNYLMVAHFSPKTSSNKNINIHTRTDVTLPSKIPGFEELMYEPTEYYYNNDEKVKQFNFIYFGPKSGKNKSVPLIVLPHGGPHSNFMNIFSLDYSVFTLLGMAVLQVNFRGSTGMGSDNVEYVQGRVGTTDVLDCVTATQETLKKYSWLDPERVGVYGGSHGGFLAAHLSAQHANLYKAVVTRCPVIDISSMFTTSDIPDCRNTLTMEEQIKYRRYTCAVEAGFPYSELIDEAMQSQYAEMITKMLKCSPISHVHKVKAPTLVCIGTNDLRVPQAQGKIWYNKLKANNVKTRMLVYEDNHRLSSGSAEIDNIINSYLWLNEHMPPKEG